MVNSLLIGTALKTHRHTHTQLGKTMQVNGTMPKTESRHTDPEEQVDPN